MILNCHGAAVFRSVFFLFLLGVCNTASARVITVGPTEEQPSIKEAIASAGAGDTIILRSATYREGNLIIRKPLTILGQSFPTLDGEGKHEILTVTASNVTLKGLRLINTGHADIEDIAAIKGLDVQGLKILGNQFEETSFGVYLANASHCLVEGNSFTGTKGLRPDHAAGNGIHAWKSHHIEIRKNNVTGHRDGIYFEFVTKSLVEANVCAKNLRYGLHFMFSHEDDYINNTFQDNGAGVAVMYTKNVRMIGNHFENNQGEATYALLLKDIGDSRIEFCRFGDNTIGLYMEGSSRVVVTDNEFSQNGWALKIQANCDNNTVERNNFLGNTFDVTTNGSLSLNVFKSNYWDKYDGYDLNRDGIGDVPFHPVSLYGMIVEKMPTAVLLWRSFLVFLLDRAEKVVPAVTPENLRDNSPVMKFYDRS